jgi:hypothetical protein
MSLELIKETIRLDQAVRKETVQVIVEGDIIVPDVKPDMAKVLEMDGKVEIEQVEISKDRMNYKGQANFSILYIAEGADRPVHSMEGNLGIEDFINVDGIRNDMYCGLNCDIEHIHFTVLNGRKINVKAIVAVDVQLMNQMKSEIVVNAKSPLPLQIRKQPLTFSMTGAKKEDKMIIKDELTIPAGKPNIRDLLKCDVTIANKETKVIDGKVVVKGDLNVRTLYSGDMDENVVDFVEHQIPFNGLIECQEAAEDMYGDIDIKILQQYVQIRPDLDGEERMLEVETVLLAKVQLMQTQEIEVIEDAYCPGKEIHLKKDKIQYQKLIGKNKAHMTIKEAMYLEETAPDMVQVYNVMAKPKVEEIQLMEDKIMVEGVLEEKIIYMTKDDKNPIYVYEDMIPFKHGIEAKGTTMGKKVDLKTVIDHMECGLVSPREVEIRAVLRFDAQVLDEQEVYMVIDMEEEELDPNIIANMPGLIIYMVQTGDSLWKIAKKYNTTIEELACINDIEDPDHIYPGQKLLILKRVPSL